MKVFLTQDHMGLEISKHYSDDNFHLMSAKLHVDNGLAWWDTGYFVGNWPSFKNVVAL